MDDRVADILAERAALSRSPQAGLIASALLHAGLIAAVVASTRGAAAPIPKQTIVMMRLSGHSSPAAHPLARRAVHPSRPPASKKTRVPVVEAAPPEEPAPPVPAKKRVDASLFGRSKDRAAQGPASPLPHSPAPSTDPADAAVPAPGQAGVTAIEGGDFPYTSYIDRMVGLIGTHWFRPQNGGAPLARVYFLVERGGVIRGEVKIEQSSGNPAFDRAAVRAVLEASPLPPLPYAYAGQFIGVHLTFH